MFLGLLADSAISTGCEDDKILLSLRVDEAHLLLVGHAQVFFPFWRLIGRREGRPFMIVQMQDRYPRSEISLMFMTRFSVDTSY